MYLEFETDDGYCGHYYQGRAAKTKKGTKKEEEKMPLEIGESTKINPSDEEEQKIVYKTPKSVIVAFVALMISCTPLLMAIHNTRVEADRQAVRAAKLGVITRKLAFTYANDPRTHKILRSHGASLVKGAPGSGLVYSLKWDE